MRKIIPASQDNEIDALRKLRLAQMKGRAAERHRRVEVGRPICRREVARRGFADDRALEVGEEAIVEDADAVVVVCARGPRRARRRWRRRRRRRRGHGFEYYVPHVDEHDGELPI